MIYKNHFQKFENFLVEIFFSDLMDTLLTFLFEETIRPEYRLMFIYLITKKPPDMSQCGDPGTMRAPCSIFQKIIFCRKVKIKT